MFLFNRERAIDSLEIQPNDKILDLACGTGLNIHHLIKKSKSSNIMGIDYSESMLGKAKQMYPSVKFIREDVSKYKFNQKFDKVICTYSLSMIEEWKRTILNIRKALNKGGKFVILDFHPWRGIIKPIYPVFRWWLGKHGVDAERNALPVLKKHFKHVEKKIMNSGYNSIIIATLRSAEKVSYWLQPQIPL